MEVGDTCAAQLRLLSSVTPGCLSSITQCQTLNFESTSTSAVPANITWNGQGSNPLTMQVSGGRECFLQTRTLDKPSHV